VNRWLSFLVVLFLVGCGSSRSARDSWTLEDLDDEVADSSGRTRVERAAVTTEVDPINFAPVGPTTTSFPVTTKRLFVSFRLRGVAPDSRLSVAWFREGEDQPLSETSETLSGDQRLAAEHQATTPFAPGPHFVRLSLDGEVLAQVPFEIEGPDPGAAAASASPATVSNLAVYAALDRRGQPRGRPSRTFPARTKSVHCAFLVSGASPGTAVTVRWMLGASVVATTDLGEVSGRRVLSATLDAPAALDSGEYTVEVQVHGQQRATATFTVLGGVTGGGRVVDLVLTRAIDRRTHRPSAAPTTNFSGDEETIYLCISHERLGSGDVVEVRWFQDDYPDEPMAVSTVPASGTGSLAASLSPDEPLPAGDYHADVVLRGRTVASVPFTVGP
jgi:hypothetical protein